MPSKNPTIRRATQLAWYKKRRNDWITANGPCKRCGSEIRLEVDHIDRSTKLFKPSRIWSRKKEVREAELNKCQVLCKKCHKIKTLSEVTKPDEHGTIRQYNRGCRCRPCTKAKVISINEWRWKTGRRKRTN